MAPLLRTRITSLTRSESNFFKERLNNLEKQEETVTKASDDAYAGADNAELVKEKNFEIVTTELAGSELAIEGYGKVIPVCVLLCI